MLKFSSFKVYTMHSFIMHSTETGYTVSPEEVLSPPPKCMALQEYGQLPENCMPRLSCCSSAQLLYLELNLGRRGICNPQGSRLLQEFQERQANEGQPLKQLCHHDVQLEAQPAQW